MRTILMIFGGLFFALVLLLVGVGTIVGFTAYAKINDAKAYVELATLEIGESYDPEVFRKHLSPEAVANTGVLEQVSQLLLTTFGPITSVDKVEYPSFQSGVTAADGQYFVAVCQVAATSTKGDLAINFTALHRKENWETTNFYVDWGPDGPRAPAEQSV
ncbi:hypothetical protein [Parvularcula lutaonensis]|uniref:Uncharacterized protein n=1 Tax=Parvularcula lutaonensis TaxID=491923 RepID=A0ABV7MBJ7_9PROT|nr:hypothetical protein [Parvularcula lutaonensis]GGY40703.1 hypothetical protein GCM10007148_06520 [Parvularcula lutaonensis]